jgi:hypothetical protein
MLSRASHSRAQECAGDDSSDGGALNVTCRECEVLARLYEAALQSHAEAIAEYHLAIAAWNADRIRRAKRRIKLSEIAVEEYGRRLAAHQTNH